MINFHSLQEEIRYYQAKIKHWQRKAKIADDAVDVYSKKLEEVLSKVQKIRRDDV
tara:strand:- start:6550 stop:6714 length:165 start_codon:yes stop_codon:yes gene_type:complete